MTFVGFIPFDCKISSLVYYDNTLKLKFSIVTKKTQKLFLFNSKTGQLEFTKNLGRDFFGSQNVSV